MASSRRAARGRTEVPVNMYPNHVTQHSFQSPRGKVRALLKGGVCYRVMVSGTVRDWGASPDLRAALLDGSFGPFDAG